MIGIIIQLLLSALFLWFFEREKLAVLGWGPSRERIFQLFTAIVLAIVMATIYHLVSGIISGTEWQQNPLFRIRDLLNGLWWMLKSVIYEELIFRGALFYIALKRLGVKKALWLSATAFGIYHWFSYGAFGQPIQMIFIFLITAAAGWMYAYAFVKTNSLYFPIGLHFGWNLIGSLLFSQGSIGKHILIPITYPQFHKNELIAFLFMMLYQLLVPVLATWLWLRKLKGEKVYE